MEAAMFQSAFSALTDPVLLHKDDQWLQNPAAQALGLSDNELAALAALPQEGGLVALGGIYYHASISPMEGDACYVLRRDALLLSAEASVASQLGDQISPMLSLVTRLAQRLPAKKPDAGEDSTQLLAQLNRRLYRLLYVTRQLQLASETGDLLLAPESVDLVDYLTTFCAQVSSRCEGFPLTLRLEPPQGEIPTIQADQRMLCHLLMCLLSNSIKAMEGKPCEVTLSLLSGDDDRVILSFLDNGPGLSPDALSSPLWARPNDFIPDRGVGLGLPLAQRIVAAHSGTMVIKPTPKGTQFVISLPAEPGLTLHSTGAVTVDVTGGISTILTHLSSVLPASYFAPPIPDPED